MLSGRIMIVSDRDEVILELEPIVRAGAHLALTVQDGEEAIRVMGEGVVPDLVITDLGGRGAGGGLEYVSRFRELNRLGRHMVVVEDGTAGDGGDDAEDDPVTRLPRPFHRPAVRAAIEDAVQRIDRELVSLRGEMWRELSRMQQAVRDVQRDAVDALAATIAARDPYMHGHATRVTELADRVADEMGVSRAGRDVLRTACRLHEIGKIAVPLELLHKTEPLAPEELDRIRAHPRVGADIVRGVPSLQAAAPVIEHQGTDHRTLHEHLEPTSAEFVLAGILRVVDAFDAMVSARSYRGPLPRDYWESTLRRGAGQRFHPDAVEALLCRVDVSGLPPEARTS